MNRQAKKKRAKLRSQRYASEKVIDALIHGPRRDKAVLRHGKSVTFYQASGKPAHFH